MPGSADFPDFAAPDDGEDGPYEMFLCHDAAAGDADVGGAGRGHRRTIPFEELRMRALGVFAKALQTISGKEVPPLGQEESLTYLSLAELVLILREHGREEDAGIVIAGDTRDEAQQRFKDAMGALVSRIFSNVLHAGVASGALACEFDPETNDFEFNVTEEGRKRHGGDEPAEA